MKERAKLFLGALGATAILYTGAFLQERNNILQKTADAFEVVSYHPRAWTREVLWAAGNASSSMSRLFWDAGDSIRR